MSYRVSISSNPNKEKDEEYNAKTLTLLQREKSFHGSLDESPLIESMHTLTSLSTTMSWKFSDLASSIAQAIPEASEMHGSRN